MKEEEGVLVAKVGQEEFQNSPELVNGYSIEVDAFYEIGYYLLGVDYEEVCVHQNPVYDFEDDVLHAWEVEGLDVEFDTVLNPDSLMDLILVVVLHSQHQVEFHLIGLLSVGLHQVDQVIHDIVREGFDVLDDNQNHLLS